jgi:eukaryotic-like serine/threonine-protein kinase
MPAAGKTEALPSTVEEDRVAAALVGRGLVTREEVQQCRGEPAGAQAFLDRLMAAGFLTPSQVQRLTPDLAQFASQQIPGYQILHKLGQGGMGTVYKAKQLSMNRLVALKILHPRLAANKEYLDRFRREAHTAARFSSNNVVQAIDVGSAGHVHYFVMEYVEGKTVMDELTAGKIFGEREALDIILQVAQALREAYKRGLIHRDIKPANIILTKEGVVKLADLGLARDTTDRAAIEAERGALVGTPYYIAPEQIEGQDDVDIRVDLYSLGATLYHMVTGRPPFTGEGRDAVFDAHLEKDLTPPEKINKALSAGVGEVVDFLMAKDREDRYRTPEELIIDLECLLNGEPPRLARQHFSAALLAGLAEGEEATDESRRKRRKKKKEMAEEDLEWWQRKAPMWWVLTALGLLGVSLLLNLLLTIRIVVRGL